MVARGDISPHSASIRDNRHDHLNQHWGSPHAFKHHPPAQRPQFYVYSPEPPVPHAALHAIRYHDVAWWTDESEPDEPVPTIGAVSSESLKGSHIDPAHLVMIPTVSYSHQSSTCAPTATHSPTGQFEQPPSRRYLPAPLESDSATVSPDSTVASSQLSPGAHSHISMPGIEASAPIAILPHVKVKSKTATEKARFPCGIYQCFQVFESDKDLRQHHEPSVHSNSDNSGAGNFFRCHCGKKAPRKDNHETHFRRCRLGTTEAYRCRCGREADDTKDHLNHLENGSCPYRRRKIKGKSRASTHI